MSTLNVNLQYPSHPNIRERKYNSGVIQAEFRFNVLRVQKKKKNHPIYNMVSYESVFWKGPENTTPRVIVVSLRKEQ